MPNNIVFNEVASQLQTQIYGQYNGATKAINTDSQGNLITTALPQFTSTSVTLTGITTATVTALTSDTSLRTMYSFYVKNDSATNTATFTAWLQISPVDSETYYVNDSSSAYTVGGQSKAVLVAARFLNYTRLLIQGSDTASAIIYYNAQ